MRFCPDIASSTSMMIGWLETAEPGMVVHVADGRRVPCVSSPLPNVRTPFVGNGWHHGWNHWNRLDLGVVQSAGLRAGGG
ncbi:hypothetical protein F511_32041 [Dorcoceras hygrometricum]|uniref:Uncharacterized protein n=1 Tax=Dorcoceras hygrometricum TaxID=472368 RepID=A0A2Z7A8P9_9LAMI|nr:hypothetical protein F511_32041 [Dorcoceras hygrometricum]